MTRFRYSELVRVWAKAGLLCAALMAGPVGAKLPDRVSIAPAPDWTFEPDMPAEAFAPEKGSVAWRYVSEQYRFEPDDSHYSSFYAVDLTTPEGVDENGNLEITFDPGVRTLTLHWVRAVRDGQVVDLLDDSSIESFSIETAANQNIFQGQRKVVVMMPDLRVGDRLEYAYTLSGRKASMGGEVATSIRTAYSDPYQSGQHRVSFADGMQPHHATFLGAPEPNVSRSGGYTHYDLTLGPVAPFITDDNQPKGARTLPAIMMTSFADWAEVGNLFAPHYAVTEADRRAVADIVREIEAAHAVPGERALAALPRVQDDIRYVSLSMGDGGYVPRRPETVLARRYGDCKDVTLLLLALLDGLGVEATPVLVNTSQQGGVFRDTLPSQQFDHVVVQAVVDGETIVLDATTNSGLGDFASFGWPYYGKGLEMRPGASRRVDMPVRETDHSREFVTSVDLRDRDRAAMKLEEVYVGLAADGFRTQARRDGLAAIDKTYRDFLRDHHPSLEAGDAELKVEFDDARAIAKASVAYTIPDPWQETEESGFAGEFPYTFFEVTGRIPTYDGAERSTGYAISHPVRVTHRYDIDLSGSWNLNDEEAVFDTPAFTAHVSQTYDSEANRFTVEARYESKADVIAPEDFKSSMEQLDKFRGELYPSLLIRGEGANAGDEPEMGIGEALTYGVVALLMLGFGFARSRTRAEDG